MCRHDTAAAGPKRGPEFLDRVEDLPRQVDLFGGREQRWVAEQHVENQSLVCLRRALRERTAVAEVHRDVTYLHRRAARHLGAKADRHALVGLYADHDRVLAELACRGRLERQVRRAFEHDGDLGDTLAETLAGTKIERHTGPAAGVDVKPDRRIGLGGRRRVNALLLQVSDDVMRALPAGGVLSASGVCGEVLRQTHRGEDLRLLGGQVGGGERDRLLHGGQGPGSCSR